MLNILNNSNIILLSFLGGVFTFLATTLGAGIVFFFKKINKTILDAALAIAAGIMLSSSFFSLIEPAIEMTNKKEIFILAIGILSGSFFIILFDIIHKLFSKKKASKTNLLMTSITVHNIPEGLILGVSYASIINNKATLTNALILTLAIAIQNFPEGCAISLPLRRENKTRLKAFIMGSLSAIVEPIFSTIGCLLVIEIKTILPFMLTFASGAMIYVIIAELIPEYTQNKRKILMNSCTIIGFIIMMILDIFFC
ncbi:MAG: ZIP family metal transporter [Bacilli bacterium]|nr:ZIP family metal transporter [Bacilli bacterium]